MIKKRISAFLLLLLSGALFAQTPPSLNTAPLTATSESKSAQAVSLNQSILGRTQIPLAKYKGRTFLDFLIAPDGLKAALDSDTSGMFKIAGKNNVNAAGKDFDPAVYSKIIKIFTNGAAGFDALVDSLAGTQANPVTIVGAIANKLQTIPMARPDRLGLNAVVIAPYLSLVSGAGVSVIINSQNYFCNLGYKPGSADPVQLEKHVKSGRSYGFSPMHKALDVSDMYYLQELDTYLAGTPDYAGFYKTLLDLIISCDASGYAGLPPLGQAVATDFLAVYTAELDRHAMTSFTKHPWENDLAEITIISAFITHTRKVVLNGVMVSGAPANYFGVSASGMGSGIGITRRDRQILQRSISDFERNLHPELVAGLEKLIGAKPGGDVIHGLMLFLNNPANQPVVRKSAKQIADVALAFILQVHADADQIATAFRAKGVRF